MKFSIAVHYCLCEFGVKLLKEKTFAHMLCDYGCFRINKGARNILTNLIKDEFLYKIVRMKLAEYQVEVKKFISNTGFDEQITTDIVKIIRRVYRNILQDGKYIKKIIPNIDRSKLVKDEFGFMYTPDYKILCDYDDKMDYKEHQIHSIKEGCLMIIEPGLRNCFCDRLELPPSVRRIIGDSMPSDIATPITNCEVICMSPFFVYENGLLMTADKRKLIKCFSRSALVELPKEIVWIDKDAFPVVDTWNEYGYYPPYILTLKNYDYKNQIRFDGTHIISSGYLNNYLKSMKESYKTMYVGNIFIDIYGVIYSQDKKILLCYPKELDHRCYAIIDECEIISSNAFVYHADLPCCCLEDIGWELDKIEIEDSNKATEVCNNTNIVEKESSPLFENSLFNENSGIQENMEGNSLEVLRLPSHLKEIQWNALTGLTCLKSLVIDKSNKDRNINILVDYDKNDDNVHVLRHVSLQFE